MNLQVQAWFRRSTPRLSNWLAASAGITFLPNRLERWCVCRRFFALMNRQNKPKHPKTIIPRPLNPNGKQTPKHADNLPSGCTMITGCSHSPFEPSPKLSETRQLLKLSIGG